MFCRAFNSILGALLICAALQTPARGEDFEFFEQHIRPVLVNSCYPCHSVTAGKSKGGLLLDTKESILKGGDSGPAIVPGDPDHSLLIKAVRYTDKDLQMPPKGKRLPQTETDALAAWVIMGAPDPRNASAKPEPPKSYGYDFVAARKQWAFTKPKEPTVPAVNNKHWPRNAIDNFILAKLEEKNLAPAAPADKRALIRRATYDLTGLPPSPKEVDAFLADKSPNAFAKVVDRLLASPQYGERWARHWLDVVRYTDSLDSRGVGSEGDSREAYRYRDWVVNALNRDLPYDQFIREQIAGDLLQPADPERIDTNGIIATGMYAIGNWGNGDADKDKILTDIADDQVDVTGRAFLGLTLACARCHDHKFDPIPTADYYSMAGIFFSSHILSKLAAKGAGESLMYIPLASRAELERRKKREERIAQLEKEIAATSEEEIARLANAMLPHTAEYLLTLGEWRNQNTSPTRTSVAEFASSRGRSQLLPELLEQWVNYLGFAEAGLLSRVTHNLADKEGLHALRNVRNADTPNAVINTTPNTVAFSTITMPPRSVSVHPSPKAGVAVVWKSPISGSVEIKGRVADADPNCGDGIDWKIETVAAGGTREIASGAIPNGGAQSFSDGRAAANLNALRVNAGDAVRVIVSPKGDYSCDTTVVELVLTDRANPKNVWNLASDVIAAVATEANPYPDRMKNAAVWAFYDMQAQAAIPESPADSPIQKWLSAVKHNVSENELSALSLEVQKALLAADATNSSVKNIYRDLTNPHGAFWADASALEKYFAPEAQKILAADKSELTSLRAQPTPPLLSTHGLAEGGVPESPHAGVHDVRIHVRGRYDRLGDATPRRFPRLLAGDDQRPITTGSGRLELANWVSSPENPLTARVMVNRIWQHHFGEGIVRTPNNFGKLGTAPTHPELLDFLARRFIDSGWSIKAMHRAIMLSATYQQSSVPQAATLRADPDNLLFGRMNRRRLESEALRDSLLAASGKLDLTPGGPAIRDLESARRTLYVMTIRSDRATYQFLFDAADPNAIVEKRIDSTVAPQALFLLNHPFVMAQARETARRVLKEAPPADKDRIQWLYRSLYSRPATPPEIKIGMDALIRARASAADNELAWTEYCQILVCANEFMYID
jgi:hypothetical protein